MAGLSILASCEIATAAGTNLFSGGSKLDPEYGVGNWIWAAETHDQQTCRFWKRVDISQNALIERVQLTLAVDNAYHLFVDGREIGQGVIWYNLTEYDLTRIVGPGTHILALECFNDYERAGLVAGLRVELRDGRSIEVPTDASWKIVPNDESDWTTQKNPDSHWAAATEEARFADWILKGRTVRVFHRAPIEPITLTFWQSYWFHVLMVSTCIVLAVLCLWLLGKLAVYSQAQQIVRRERSRIARDIHDDLTAGLTQLALFGEVARSELPEGSEARRQVAKICEKARGLSRAMNEVIWMVNSQRDTFRDFTSYLCKYAETFLEATPIRCRFDVEEDLPDFPCDLGARRNLFLGVKEALNNAARHSGANELVLRIHWREQQMVVAVEDNGKGFDPILAGQQGNGLSNMILRGAEAGGICRIVSRSGAGCRVEFIAPSTRTAKHHLEFWKRRPSGAFQASPAHFTPSAVEGETGSSSAASDVAATETPARQTPAP
jgi:signal transduction histidine kinase